MTYPSIGRITNTGAGHRIANLAARQHGVVSTRQLRALGLTDEMIESRARDGGLHRIFRGVYAVGHRRVGRWGTMHAAVLACGEGAVISHDSAAELLGLWDRQPVLAHVIGKGQAGRSIQGIQWHRAVHLESDEVVAPEGIRCTSASRTLVDLAGRCGESSLRRLVEQAAVLRLLDVEAIDCVLARGRRRGSPRLRAVLAAWRAEGEEPPQLRSGIEARLLAALVEAGLPRPRSNVVLQLDGSRLEVDFLWEQQRLVVETDGEQVHGTSGAFRHDRWRDQILTAAGYRTARITWSQLEEEPEAILSRIRRMLKATPSD